MLRACLKIAILLLMLAAATVNASPEQVARVALAVGEATRINAAGRAEPMRLGSALAAGDRIITGKDALAILVFSDEGRVSLRADSELVIHRYRVDPSGVDTRLELELVRGAMRQISGDAARLQPERYRLNTPVAAIGVRGTDFLAKADAGSMETFVHEGMIVVLPSGKGCAQGGSGDCRPLASLSASDVGQYLSVQASGQVERRTINADEVERLFGIRIAGLNAGLRGNGSAMPSSTVFVAGASAEVFAGLNGRDAASNDAINRSTVLLAAYDAQQAGHSDPVASAPIPLSPLPSTPAVPVVPHSLALPKDLVWGRFSGADSLPLQLPVSYAQAKIDRHVTVGELGQYALWRSNPSGALDRGLAGQAQFDLAAGEAIFVQSSGTSAAQLQSARLGVDFDRSTFSAGGTVAHAVTGAVNFAVDGKVNDEGVFWGGNAAQRVAGALTRDGTQAGYLFSKEVAQGIFQGITLWNVR